jgi:kanamycin kinase
MASFISGPPAGDVELPSIVRQLARGRRVRPVWRNGFGGLTVELSSDADSVYVKWLPADNGHDLHQEVLRLEWAVQYTAVPRVLEHGRDAEGSWFVSAALPGESAVDDRWKAEPATAVRAIGEGLRALHEALPVTTCPFSWEAEDRWADTVRRVDEGYFNLDYWRRSEHAHLDLAEALALAADPPPVDRGVVCHGDACAPNTLLYPSGRWCGHVDLGALGRADRWADLAVATWSTEWNYGPGWEELLLSAYGIGPDPERTHYYRLLWDLGP